MTIENELVLLGAVNVFEGRTGMGLPIVIKRSGVWTDVTYETPDGEHNGFALNPKYAVELGNALIQAGYAARAEAELRRPPTEGSES